MPKSNYIVWLGRKLQIVPANKIAFDPRYQRKIVNRLIDQITSEFDPNALRVIVANKRKDGLYYVIDGQHRAKIMLAKGIEIGAEVHEGLTSQQEADLFVKLNETRYVSKTYTFRANYHAHHKVERAIAAMVSLTGFKIKWEAGRPKLEENVITALGTLRFIYGLYGPTILEDTLTVIKSAFSIHGSVVRVATRDMFLRGVALYLFESKATADDLIPALTGIEADDIFEACSKTAYRGNIQKLIAEHLTGLVASRRRRGGRRAA